MDTLIFKDLFSRSCQPFHQPAECPWALHVYLNSSCYSTGFFFLVAFQMLDTDNDGYLSYSELFSLFRMVTGPSLTDDHVLGIITSILSRSDLQQPTRLTLEEFTNVSHGTVFVAVEQSIIIITVIIMMMMIIIIIVIMMIVMR